MLGLNDYRDSTHYHDGLSLLTIMIVECLTIYIVILYKYAGNTCKLDQLKYTEMISIVNVDESGENYATIWY